MMNDKVVYFSLKKKRADSFYDYVSKNEYCYQRKFSFGFLKPKEPFQDPRDLIPLIEEARAKELLHVIIDYTSCSGIKFYNYAEVIRDLIMAYPEVQFLFDETFVKRSLKEKKYCFLNFLFQDAGDNISEGNIDIGVWKNGKEKSEKKAFKVLADWHTFNLWDTAKKKLLDDRAVEKQLIRMLKGQNNMYDGSNLRCAIRAYKFDKLCVQNNFSKLSDSRLDNAAIVVEEEYRQAMFNGYCLYANGYRVLPIMTATELNIVNKNADSIVKGNVQLDNNLIVVRDYDLQFLDEKKVEIENQQEGFTETDYIRGAKHYKEDENNKLFKKVPAEDLMGNPFWDKLAYKHTMFISKGGDKLLVKPNRQFFKEGSHKGGMCILDSSEKLGLYGIKKPIEGIYKSIHTFSCVKDRYNSTLYDKKNKDEYKIITGRQGADGHSLPLDIYGIARSVLHRSDEYYSKGHYRKASLLAGEAMLILNGFHIELMKKAYYLQAVSENAMAMSLLGGDEGKLCDDIFLRLDEKVKKEVDRILEDDRKGKENLLMNIYNDCRLFCQEKEHLEAANDALSIMVRMKEKMLF